MSKKNKNQAVSEEQKETKRGSIQEPATKTEKIISYILIGAALIAILLIIIIAISTGGEKQKIARKFDSLTKDNVYTYISYEKLQEKVNNGEEFEVLLISDKQENANYFIYCVDLIVKQYQNDDNYNSEDTIFLLNIDKLDESEQKYFKNIDKRILDEPVIVHYKTMLKKQSVDYDKSNNYRIDEYGNNVFALLQKYFENNFTKKVNDIEEE